MSNACLFEVGIITPMKTSVAVYDTSKFWRTGWLMGCLAGLIFSLAAWGIDAAELVESHAVFPWIKIVLGTIIAVITGGLCGYFCARVDRGLPALLFWLIWGVGMVYLAAYFPYQITEKLIALLNPTLGNEIHYPVPPYHETRVIIGLAIAIVLCGIASFLFFVAHEHMYTGMYIGSAIVSMAIWLVLFVAIGLSLDDFYNQPIRRPITVISDTIDVARENKNLYEKPREASQLGISGLRDQRALIDRPYHVAMKSYEDITNGVEALVDFDGFWITCSATDSQLIHCK
jgi:hypothetical protein